MVMLLSTTTGHVLATLYFMARYLFPSQSRAAQWSPPGRRRLGRAVAGLVTAIGHWHRFEKRPFGNDSGSVRNRPAGGLSAIPDDLR